MNQPDHVQSSRPGLKLGRLAPHVESTHPRLKLGEFLRPGYSINVPPAVDYVSSVGSWPMSLNSDLGDCTAAAAGHLREAWTRYGQGATVLTTDADILKFYSLCSGYVPGRPDTDQGAVMQDCLNVWRKTGLAGDRILAFFQIDPANLAELKAALYLFGGCYVGVGLPTSALDQFDAGKSWDFNPGLDNRIEGGHCVHLGAVNAAGLMTVTTWGRTQLVTPLWASHFVEECWAVVSQDWIRDFKSPEGLDTVALNAAFQDMTHQPGPFPVAPTPTPTPVPTPTPTPVPPAVSVADQALAGAISKTWLEGTHVGGNSVTQTALKDWFKATGLTPGKK
jgi:hypothetical protein